ncbi:hypothetical protein LX99_04951 [Mucilaginibacter oryzae]|uniref:Uncharacterized protein n=1 Tax=Mucilaginibacter oryzae TaxID=468058 RepID=A0A316GUJ3_9SPHI|nr:hypothetical protein LX99_04951 [Mucilaginibacter oryzae]
MRCGENTDHRLDDIFVYFKICTQSRPAGEGLRRGYLFLTIPPRILLKNSGVTPMYDAICFWGRWSISVG